MSAPRPPGWYPDPRDAAVLRYFDGLQWTEQTNPPTPGAGPGSTPAPARSTLDSTPTWVWVALVATLLVLVTVLVLTITRLPPFPSRPQAESTAAVDAPPSSTPRPNPLKSKMVPELTFPRGSLVAGHSSGQPEIWGVPLPYADTVRVLRPMLPIGQEYDEMPWGEETLEDTKTVWQWGAAGTALTVTVTRNNAQSTNVYLDRT